MKSILPGRGMTLSFDLKFNIGGSEVKSLWMFLNVNEKHLDADLSALMHRLESELWNHLSIDEMNNIELSMRAVNE